MTDMPLFTFVLEFDGGTHISQFRAASVVRAVHEYGDQLLRDKAVAKMAVRKRLSAAFSAENPVAIKGMRNVWNCSASIGQKLAILNLVATSVPGEPDKDDNTLNETVILNLPKSACLSEGQCGGWKALLSEQSPNCSRVTPLCSSKSRNA